MKKRRKKRNKSRRTPEEIDFIRGRKKKIQLGWKKHGLGFSPVERTRSGAGSHGKKKRAYHKSERQEARRKIRKSDW